jgi:hypothetical protein
MRTMRRWLVADLTAPQMRALRAAVWARMNAEDFVNFNQRAVLRRAWLSVMEAWERGEETSKDRRRIGARPCPPAPPETPEP